MTALAVALMFCGWIGALLSVYLLLTSIAAFFYRQRLAPELPSARLVVLIPAHNEEGLIAQCVRSMRDQSYPPELLTVTVIADNCTDRTAEVARAAGADDVLDRHEPQARGKGRALRWALERVLAAEDAPDAVVIVDADTYAEPDFLREMGAEFEAGAAAVQADNLLRGTGGKGSSLRVAAFILINRVRQSGRVALGQSAMLLGNGMLLSRDLLSQRSWTAFTSAEDLEFTLDLQLEGVNVAYARRAQVSSETAPTPDAAATQQRRWEGGRFALARAYGLRVLSEARRQRRPGLLLLAVELVMPPLGLLTAGIVVGCAVTAGVAVTTGHRWALAPWVLAGAALPLYVGLGLKAGEAPRDAYRALLGAPLFVLRKPVQMRGIFGFKSDSWVRTARSSEESQTRGS
jgi:1,2-diacylglycerol 3-beta-glucosyltransferase